MYSEMSLMYYVMKTFYIYYKNTKVLISISHNSIALQIMVSTMWGYEWGGDRFTEENQYCLFHLFLGSSNYYETFVCFGTVD